MRSRSNVLQGHQSHRIASLKQQKVTQKGFKDQSHPRICTEQGRHICKSDTDSGYQRMESFVQVSHFGTGKSDLCSAADECSGVDTGRPGGGQRHDGIAGASAPRKHCRYFDAVNTERRRNQSRC